MKQHRNLFIVGLSKQFNFGSIKPSNRLCFHFEFKFEPNN